MEMQMSGAWLPMWIIGAPLILIIVDWMMAPKVSSSSRTAYAADAPLRVGRA